MEIIASEKFLHGANFTLQDAEGDTYQFQVKLIAFSEPAPAGMFAIGRNHRKQFTAFMTKCAPQDIPPHRVVKDNDNSIRFLQLKFKIVDLESMASELWFQQMVETIFPTS